VILVRNFLEPKIIGKQIGINPLFTLIAMFLGLRIFGVWGLFLFPVVLIAVIKYYKSEPEESLSV
jgi:predicted PurR-regulated permease PerM